ncbi:MAG: hypothetical protein ACP5PV_06905 [Methanothrix sp.]
MQITVFCDGDIIYDNAVTVTGTKPTAWDAIKASDAGYDYTDYGGGFIFIKSIAGCGGSWGPAFYVNGGESDFGVSGYYIQDGDQLQFIGPNNGGPTAGFLYLADLTDAVEKDEPFRIGVRERSAYGYGGYDRPSSGAEVTVGNDTYQTGSDGYTEEISLDYDGFYCVGADKDGYISTYAPYFGSMEYIKVGAGGPTFCGLTGEGGGRSYAIIKYDESSSVRGEGFSSIRSTFENRGKSPSRSTKLYQKGSGSYNTEKIIKHRPSGIDLAESSQLAHAPTTFRAYRQAFGYESKYEDSIYQKNYRKTTQSSERYRDLDYINKTSLYNNSRGINFTFMADFKGTAELSARTLVEEALTNWSNKGQMEEEIFGQYTGSFQIFQRGLLPFREGELDCEEECQLECMRHCIDDLSFSEEYCSENCTEVCEKNCENTSDDEGDFELLPCCDGGWKNLTRVDKDEHSAECIFDCETCKKAANSR